MIKQFIKSFFNLLDHCVEKLKCNCKSSCCYNFFEFSFSSLEKQKTL